MNAMAIKDLAIQIRVIQKVQRELAAARTAIAQFDKELSGLSGPKVAQSGKEYEQQAKHMNTAAAAQKNLTAAQTKGIATFSEYENSIRKTKDQLKEIPKGTAAAAAGMDKLKQQTRWTAEGFIAMAKSQAAWLAGFTIIFGAIHMFIGLLKDAVGIQNEWARSVRVLTGYGSDNIEDLGEAYSELTKEMIRTGSSAKDINEVLELKGIAGFLLLFCIVLIIIIPLLFLINVANYYNVIKTLQLKILIIIF
jgi:chromosome segregation ATPase